MTNDRRAADADDIRTPPYETKSLRAELTRFFSQRVGLDADGQTVPLSTMKMGVYVFYDYDGEPIYVGQSREKLSGRIGRHLTNQRTDAVAMSVLDPFEVAEVEVFPVPAFQGRNARDPEAIEYLNKLEATVYASVLERSKFGAVLNEKVPADLGKVPLPPSFRGRIISDEVMAIRSHPDTRIARRAATIARLAQIVNERQVKAGLRQVLVVQSKRLNQLAERRFGYFAEKVEVGPETDDEDE